MLARTSNAEGGAIQRARTAAGTGVAQVVIDELAERNRDVGPLGSLGVVVGATVEPDGWDVATLNGPILAPGVGAQGGTADDVRRLFGAALPHVLPSVSREVLRHGPDAGALRGAVARLVDEFAFLRD